jgi:hypothetical protein
MLACKFRISTLIPVFLILITALAFSSPAQSARFDQPTPMASNTAEGAFPKGAVTSHYLSFTAGPGEVFVTFSFSPGRPNSELSTGTAFVGGQLSDQYGRAFTNLDAGLGRADPTSVDIAVFPGEDKTLVGHFSIPKRQRLVLRVFSSLFELEAPVKYRIRVEGGDPSFANETGRADKPVTGTVKDSRPSGELNKASATGSTGTKSVIRRSTGSAAVKTRPNSCLAEYQACLKRSMILKTPGATSQCVIQRSYCERRQRDTAASGATSAPQGVGDVAGQNGTAQQGTNPKRKKVH